MAGNPLAELDAAMAALRGAQASVPTISAPSGSYVNYTSPLARATGINPAWAKVISDISAPDTVANTPGAAAQQTQDMPWWKRALGVIDIPRSLIANTVNDIATGHGGGWGNAVSTNVGKHLTTADVLNNMGWHATTAQNESDPAVAKAMAAYENSSAPVGGSNWNNAGRSWTGFIGDLLTDPLSYLSFGATGVAKKAGQTALEQAARDTATKAGVTVARDSMGDIANGTAQQIYKKTIADFANNPHVNSDLVERMAQRKASEAYNNITNAGKQAQIAAENRLVSLDLPFTHLSMPIANKPGFLRLSEQTIGETGAQGLLGRLSGLGVTNEGDISKILGMYGKSAPHDLTAAQAENLHNVLDEIGAPKLPQLEQKLSTAPGTYASTYTPQDFIAELQHGSPQVFDKAQPMVDAMASNPSRLSTAGADALKSYGELAGTPPLLGKTAKGTKTLDAINQSFSNAADKAVNVGKTIQKPTEQVIASAERTPADTISNVMAKKVLTKMMSKQHLANLAEAKAGSSQLANVMQRLALEHPTYMRDPIYKGFVTKFLSDRVFKAFNPRTIGSPDSFVDTFANLIRDSENRVRGGRYQAHIDVSRLKAMTKDMSPKELEAVGYTVENKFPGTDGIGRQAAADKFLQGLTPDQLKNINAVADHVRNTFSNMAQRELAAGSLSYGNDLKNYYYHLYRDSGMNKDEISRILKDPVVQKWMGRSAANRSNITRQGFETLADYKDAQTALEKAHAHAADPAEAESIQAKLDHLNGLIETDPAKVVEARYRNHIQSTAMAQLYKDLSNNGMIREAKDMIHEGAADTFKKLTSSEVRRFLPNAPEGKSFYMHKDIYTGLQKTSKLFTNEGANKFVDYVDHITNMLKSLMTTWNPQHQYTRYIGNLSNAMMGGATTGDFQRAVSFIRKLKAGNLTPNEEKFAQEVFDKGILGVNMNLDWNDPMNPLRAGDSKFGNALGKAEHWVHNNKYAKTMNTALTFSDNMSRLALFMRGWKAYGGDANKAAQLVRKYLFNYNELTSADRIVRRAVPFWNWTKHNLPLQIMEFMRQPRYYATYEKFQRALNPNNQPSPDYGQDYLHVAGNYFFNPRLPLQDLTSYGSPVRSYESMLGGLNPMIKDPFEIRTNTQFFNNMPIDKYAVPGQLPSSQSLAEYFLQQLGAPSKVMGTVEDTSSGKQPLWNELLNYSLGKLSNFDPVKLAKENAWQAKEARKMQKEKQKAQAKAASSAVGG